MMFSVDKLFMIQKGHNALDFACYKLTAFTFSRQPAAPKWVAPQCPFVPDSAAMIAYVLPLNFPMAEPWKLDSGPEEE